MFCNPVSEYYVTGFELGVNCLGEVIDDGLVYYTISDLEGHARAMKVGGFGNFNYRVSGRLVVVANIFEEGLEILVNIDSIVKTLGRSGPSRA
jgi:hypothetical protein